MRFGSAPETMVWATRWASVAVFPVPAPAMTRSGPPALAPPWVAARRCSGLSASSQAEFIRRIRVPGYGDAGNHDSCFVRNGPSIVPRSMMICGSRAEVLWFSLEMKTCSAEQVENDGFEEQTGFTRQNTFIWWPSHQPSCLCLAGSVCPAGLDPGTMVEPAFIRHRRGNQPREGCIGGGGVSSLCRYLERSAADPDLHSRGGSVVASLERWCRPGDDPAIRLPPPPRGFSSCRAKRGSRGSGYFPDPTCDRASDMAPFDIRHDRLARGCFGDVGLRHRLPAGQARNSSEGRSPGSSLRFPSRPSSSRRRRCRLSWR